MFFLRMAAAQLMRSAFAGARVITQRSASHTWITRTAKALPRFCALGLRESCCVAPARPQRAFCSGIRLRQQNWRGTAVTLRLVAEAPRSAHALLA